MDMKYYVTFFDDLSTGLGENLPQTSKLRLIEGDVRDFDLVERVIRNHPFVMHLAAQVSYPMTY